MTKVSRVEMSELVTLPKAPELSPSGGVIEVPLVEVPEPVTVPYSLAGSILNAPGAARVHLCSNVAARHREAACPFRRNAAPRRSGPLHGPFAGMNRLGIHRVPGRRHTSLRCASMARSNIHRRTGPRSMRRRSAASGTSRSPSVWPRRDPPPVHGPPRRPAALSGTA